MISLEKGMKYVEPKKIRFNPNNPRGEKEHQIVSDPLFEKLKNSIAKFGVLEPIVVKKTSQKSDDFILIDGERRLRAAKKDRTKVIPVLIAKNDADGRILAYQIHMLRKNWGKVAETKSIKAIISDIKQKKPQISEKELIKDLKNITAHTDSEISDLLKILKYDDDIIKKVLEGKLDMSYLIQNEASFINPLRRKYSKLLSELGEDNIRKLMIEKAEKGKLHNTRFLMDKFKLFFKEEVSESNKKRIRSFINNTSLSGKDFLKECGLNVDRKGKSRNKKKIKREANQRKKICLTKTQETKLSDLRKKFEGIGKKLQNNELEYIREALECVENKCNKASVVMLWGALMDRLLIYLEQNFNDFKKECSKIDISKKPYKYYKDKIKFFCNDKCTSIDDLKTGADMPIIIWFLHMKIIDMPQFNKLKGINDTRNDCAHPTSITLTVNEAIASFCNCFDIIFNNGKI